MNGQGPGSKLLLDANGNLWGTAGNGASTNYGGGACGTVFEITPWVDDKPWPEGERFSRYCPIELAVAENTLFALPPINRSVPTTITKMTASITAYSAISCPSSCDHSLPRKSITFAPPRRLNLYLDVPLSPPSQCFSAKGREPGLWRIGSRLGLLVKNRFGMKHSLLVWRT
jgi:hypothetical protein